MFLPQFRTGFAGGVIVLLIGSVLSVNPVSGEDRVAEDRATYDTATEDSATEDSAADGKALVELNCSRCHAVGARDASPHDEAPEFRTLLQLYPIDALEEAFDSGLISSGHPDMPDFVARPDQVDAILDYFLSIQEQ